MRMSIFTRPCGADTPTFCPPPAVPPKECGFPFCCILHRYGREMEKFLYFSLRFAIMREKGGICMPFCTNCGAELHNAKFCPECGTPTGGCDTGPDLSALCDKHGTPIDLSLVLGVYRNRLSVIGYFKRFTNYSNEEIIAIVDKAIATIEPQK